MECEHLTFPGVRPVPTRVLFSGLMTAGAHLYRQLAKPTFSWEGSLIYPFCQFRWYLSVSVQLLNREPKNSGLRGVYEPSSLWTPPLLQERFSLWSQDSSSGYRTPSHGPASLDPYFPQQSGLFPSHFFLQSRKNLRAKMKLLLVMVAGHLKTWSVFISLSFENKFLENKQTKSEVTETKERFSLGGE